MLEQTEARDIKQTDCLQSYPLDPIEEEADEVKPSE